MTRLVGCAAGKAGLMKRAAAALCLATISGFPLPAGADEAPSLGVVEAVRIADRAARG